MWQAYANAVSQALPKADIVHDRFHISQHLNDAVDSVRCAENKALNKIGDNRLTEVSPFSPDFIGKSLARPLSYFWLICHKYS
ncbi:transposase, partial [Thiolapillus sp.]|uniref:transposase n=1 Tax=Thiolapillus sp. TaxID=2017437 RepID=UPI003AF6A036